ncbi:sulfur carrier protein ThiS [Planctomycetota bacterium]
MTSSLITVTVNGEDRELSSSSTVHDLLDDLNLYVENVAVELNGELLPPGNFDTTNLHDGDELEVAVFFGGG